MKKLSAELAAKSNEERFSENVKVLRIVPFVFIIISLLYLLQYRYFPGKENESEYLVNYIFLFSFVAIASTFFRILLPFLLKFSSVKTNSVLFAIYFYLMFSVSISLTLIDLQISRDYSAYAVGIFMIAYLYRISWLKYSVFSLSIIPLFAISSKFVFDNVITIEMLMPIVIFSFLSIYIVYSRETRRIQMLKLKTKLEETALRDHLTGLYNRRYLFELLSKRVALFNRYGAITSILMLDIDHFKKVNDELGHNVGDSVLESFSRLIRETIRDTDMAFRYGGEEFLIILSDTNLNNAYVLAQRLRKNIEGFSFDDVPWTITSSAGLAEIRSGDVDDTIIERADVNLYEAKRLGRNRVVK